MSPAIPLSLAFKDELTESLALKILKTIPNEYATRTIYNRGGNGYLKKNINGFNYAKRGVPFLVGTDLDRYDCPPALISDWLAQPKHHNLLIRVAVHEAEAWVLADREGFASFLGISAAKIPEDVEALAKPKETLIQLARAFLARDMCAMTFVHPPTARAKLDQPTTLVSVDLSVRVGILLSRN